MAKKASEETKRKETVDVEKQRKNEALKRAVDLIERQFGSGAIKKLPNAGARSIPAVSTGTMALDLALGVGGVPKGRVIEVFGPESSGKTTLALTIVSNAQKEGGVA